jgi:hypothetical protein
MSVHTTWCSQSLRLNFRKRDRLNFRALHGTAVSEIQQCFCSTNGDAFILWNPLVQRIVDNLRAVIASEIFDFSRHLRATTGFPPSGEVPSVPATSQSMPFRLWTRDGLWFLVSTDSQALGNGASDLQMFF